MSDNTLIILALALSALSGVLDGATQSWSKPKTKLNTNGTWSLRPVWMTRVALLLLLGLPTTVLLCMAAGFGGALLLLGLCLIIEVVLGTVVVLFLNRRRRTKT